MAYLRVVVSGVLAVGVAVAAQEEVQASLCLSVAVPAGITSVDAEEATAMISSGEMRIIDVVSCDSMAQPAGPAPRASASPTPTMGTNFGQWFASELRPDAADRASAIAGVNASSGVSSLGAPIVLSVRCHADRVDLIVTWNDPIIDVQPIMEFRSGSGATETVEALRSTDSLGIVFATEETEPFVRSLADETSLVVTYTPSEGPPMSAEFDITGIEQAMTNVWTACGVG